MEQELNKLIEEFSIKLPTKAQCNQYATKLQKYFTPYIIENYRDINEISKIFSDEFSQSDIIKATIYYMKNNQNVTGKASISTYLISMNRFFELVLLEKYPNSNLRKHLPFASFFKEIDNRLIEDGYIFNDRASNPAINADQFDFIIKYIESYDKGTLKSKQVKIIIKLYVLYGFSNNIVENLKIKDIDTNRNILEIECKNKHKIKLELPYSLSLEIKQYLTCRTDDCPLLFITDEGNQIRSSFLANILGEIKDKYESSESDDDPEDLRNQFTATGLQKYSIINMIYEGMNQSIICEFTGQSQDIYDDCQEQVNIEKELNRNRYINHMIRGIDTYDLV